ncbi:MAG: biliverdin-producing heme oxygenase, partial [Rhodoferax sp.]|nr:biliverdin-producing heme oxygenase [Rhodoferax sp.]
DHHPLLAGITKPGYALDSYQQVLLGYYHLYRVLERRITAAIARQALGFDYQARLKLPWIQADLTFFHLDPLEERHVPRHALHALEIRNPAQLAGMLYAIEGATLGGQVIARHVQTHLGLTRYAGARFFSGYAPETAAHWAAFERFLQQSCVDASSQRQACDAAVATFLQVESTLDAHHEKRHATV